MENLKRAGDIGRELAAHADPAQRAFVLRRQDLRAAQFGMRRIGQRFEAILDLHRNQRVVRALEKAVGGRRTLRERRQLGLALRAVVAGALIAAELVLKLNRVGADRLIRVDDRHRDAEIKDRDQCQRELPALPRG